MLRKLKDAIGEKVSKQHKCSECGNKIDSSNRKLRCKNCKKYFCETCESWIDKVTVYSGYKVKIAYPLCEDCYNYELENEYQAIDEIIEEEMIEKTVIYCFKCGHKNVNNKFCTTCGKKLRNIGQVSSFKNGSIDNKEEVNYYESIEWKKAAEEHYQVPCRCGVMIDIWTSKRPTKIHCEACGAKGILKRMGKKVTDDYQGELKYDIQNPSKREGEGPPMMIPCVRCGYKIKITSRKRPLKIECPKCGKKGTLHTPPPSAPPKEERKYSLRKEPKEKPMEIPCPKCKTKIVVESTKRPLKIECPKCGKKGTLK